MVWSKKLILGIAAVAVIAAILLTTMVSYNSLVSKDQDVKNKWSDIEVQVQRQVDLIPQVLAQQNVSMQFEQSLLANITALRTQWLNTLANGSVGDQVNFTNEFSVQVGSFLSVAEENPYIQSIDVVRDVIVELEGTQNRIAAARIFYNDAVNDYNTAVRSFPNNLLASSFGFEEAPYFQRGQ
ncbi:MAG: LemA family protein [Methanomassiliicoccus sp.]|nr:LemA family protein [Methanomassiliicoccus sp.]